MLDVIDYINPPRFHDSAIYLELCHKPQKISIYYIQGAHILHDFQKYDLFSNKVHTLDRKKIFVKRILLLMLTLHKFQSLYMTFHKR